MRQVLRAAVLAVFGFVILPVFAADEKKADDKKDVDKKDVDKKDVDKKPGDKKDVDKKDVDKKAPEMVDAGSIIGKIVFVDETKKTIKLKIEYPELNQGELQAMNNDMNEINKVLLTEKNPNNRINRINQLQVSIANHRARLYKVSSKDIDLTTTEDVTVRLANPTTKFDEKGKVVPYTKEELKELKGDDPKAIGYKAEFSDLRQNQIVKVALMKKKGTPVIPKPDPGKKDVDKASVADIIAEYAPHVTTVIIVAEPPPM
jgi:uncharacterized protein YifE (UPF0438 family)